MIYIKNDDDIILESEKTKAEEHCKKHILATDWKADEGCMGHYKPEEKLITLAPNFKEEISLSKTYITPINAAIHEVGHVFQFINGKQVCPLYCTGSTDVFFMEVINTIASHIITKNFCWDIKIPAYLYLDTDKYIGKDDLFIRTCSAFGKKLSLKVGPDINDQLEITSDIHYFFPAVILLQRIFNISLIDLIRSTTIFGIDICEKFTQEFKSKYNEDFRDFLMALKTLNKIESQDRFSRFQPITAEECIKFLAEINFSGFNFKGLNKNN